MRTDKILATAEFDARLPKYFLLQSSLGLLAMIFTIPILPFWVLWIGPKIHRRQYEALSAVLTERSLNINRGFLFKTQKNIPLDKITDLAVNEGPILRYLGLCSLQVETAGGGQGSAMGQAMLPGVVEATAFRDQVLEQRDRVSGMTQSPVSEPHQARATADEDPSNREVLVEIRDVLRRIDDRLERREPSS